MEIVKFLKLFFIAFPIVILLDVFWISVVASNIYKSQIGHLLRTKGGQITASIPAGLFVWALIVVGALLFVLPHAKYTSYLGQFMWGGLFGLVLYGLYDFTNLSILAGWPLSIALIDLGWGIILNGLLAIILVWLNFLF